MERRSDESIGPTTEERIDGDRVLTDGGWDDDEDDQWGSEDHTGGWTAEDQQDSTADAGGGDAGTRSGTGDGADSWGTDTGQDGDLPNHGDGLIEYPLKYPVADGYEQLLIGCGLLLCSVLIVPFFAFQGYVFRLGRAAMRRDPRPPTYDDWGGLIRDGGLFILALLPLLLLTWGLTGGAIYLILTSEQFGLAGVLLLLLLPISYVGGAIFPTFLATGSVSETYSGARFLKFAFSLPYLKGILVAFAISSGIGIVVGTVAQIIGFFWFLIIPLFIALGLQLAANVYSVCFVAALWGWVYADATDDGDVQEMTDPDRITAKL